MRNASFSDIVYELIWFVEHSLETDPEWWGDTVRDPKTGEEKPGWRHSFDSAGEWISHLLADLGILEGTDPYYLIRVPAAQCKSIDFSDFETFDCYVEAMRTLSMHPAWPYDDVPWSQWQAAKVDGLLVFRVKDFSPCFRQNIAEKDDMFSLYRDEEVLLNYARYREKIIEHWMQMSCEGRIGKAFHSKR